VITPVTVETKVAAPAIATAVVSTLGAAVYALVLSFGWFHPSAGQTAALAGMGAAVVYVVQVAVGYLVPHTQRADLSAAPDNTPADHWTTKAAQKAEPTSVQAIAPTPAVDPPVPAAPATPVAP